MINSILLLDDDVTYRRRIKEILDIAGYDTYEIENASEVIQIADQNPPALVIISIELPYDGCRKIVQSLAALSPQTEFIILASAEDLFSLSSLYDTGNVYGHCERDIRNSGELLRDVARAIERRALRRQNAWLLTELRDAREELRDQTEFMSQVEQAAATGDMAADLLDEMVEPLSALAHNAAWMDRTLHNHMSHFEPVEYCIRMIKEAKEMEGLALQCSDDIRRLRSFHSKGPGIPESLELKEILVSALRLVSHTFHRRNILLQVNFARELTQIWGCREQLHKAITYIILNAVRAMPGGGVFRVETCALEGETGGVIIRLSDTGDGMNSSTSSRIFEPFYTTRAYGEGTGLGLSIAIAAVHEADGQINVDSQPGKGAAFTITFPTIKAMPNDEIRAAA